MKKIIRASSLTDFADCPRRMISRNYPDLVTDRDSAPRFTPQTIGATVGTSVHKSTEVMHNEKIETGRFSIDRATEAGISELHKQIADAAGNTAFDDTTRDQSTAERQIKKMAAAYKPLADQVTAKYTELHLTAPIPGGWQSSGHIDLLCSGGESRDTKTGKIKSVHIFQAGNYLLLLKANGYNFSDKTWIDFIRRVSDKKAQPPIESTYYDSAIAMPAAKEVIKRIIKTVEEYEQNGNIETIPANPMSMMCSDKYCPAHSTKLCPYGKN